MLPHRGGQASDVLGAEVAPARRSLLDGLLEVHDESRFRLGALRIAVVASPVTPLRPAQLGGAQAFVCDLARGLVERGHDVTLHCAEGSDVPGVRLALVPRPDDADRALVMPGGAEPPPAPQVAAAIARMLA